MKKLFKQIPTNKCRPLSRDKKHQLLLADIGVEWYMKKLVIIYHHLEKKKLIKNHKRKMIELKGPYKLSIVIGMIGNSIYIGT